MSKKTTSTSSTSAGPKSWAPILLEALQPHRGETLALQELYAVVEKHPEFAERSKHNKDPRARIRATCQRLRDTGKLEWKGKGLWRLPESPTV